MTRADRIGYLVFGLAAVLGVAFTTWLGHETERSFAELEALRFVPASHDREPAFVLTMTVTDRVPLFVSPGRCSFVLSWYDSGGGRDGGGEARRTWAEIAATDDDSSTQPDQLPPLRRPLDLRIPLTLAAYRSLQNRQLSGEGAPDRIRAHMACGAPTKTLTRDFAVAELPRE